MLSFLTGDLRFTSHISKGSTCFPDLVILLSNPKSAPKIKEHLHPIRRTVKVQPISLPQQYFGSGKKYRERTIRASVRGLKRCTVVEDRHYLGSPPRCPNSAHRPNCRRCHCGCAGRRFERCLPSFPTGTPLSGSGAPRRCWHDQQ